MGVVEQELFSYPLSHMERSRTLNNLDDWINAIAREIKREAEKEINKEFKKTVVIYAEMFNEAIHREWDTYLSSYAPKVYDRTGMTSAGILVDDTPKVNSDGTVQASVEFVDVFMKRTDVLNNRPRHVFMAMNDGWGNKSLREGDVGYRYLGFEGLHILEKVEKEIKALLPDYINLEIEWDGNVYG